MGLCSQWPDALAVCTLGTGRSTTNGPSCGRLPGQGPRTSSAGMCPSSCSQLLSPWILVGTRGWDHSLKNPPVPLTNAHRMLPAPALSVSRLPECCCPSPSKHDQGVLGGAGLGPQSLLDGVPRCLDPEFSSRAGNLHLAPSPTVLPTPCDPVLGVSGPTVTDKNLLPLAKFPRGPSLRAPQGESTLRL